MISSAYQSHSDFVHMSPSKNAKLQLRGKFGQNIYQGNKRQEMNPLKTSTRLIQRKKQKKTGKAETVIYIFAFAYSSFRGEKNILKPESSPSHGFD